MNEPPIKLRQDAVKKRREYLQKKGTTYMLSVVGTLIALGTWPLMIILTFGFDFACTYQLVTTCVIISVIGAMTFMAASNKRQDLPYVPPVAIQLANLPPEEILLRHSNQPSAAPDELVRAASSIEATRANELLRAEQGIQDQ